MGRFIIEGGRKLGGRLRVQGAKNSALPILAATVAVGRPCVIHNCPSLTDIDSTLGILKALGCEVHRSGGSVSVDSSRMALTDIPDDLMREMRSSIIFLGALISRTGEARLCAPGGCDIGMRPIDLHLFAMEKLGVILSEEYGHISCKCAKTKGAKITLSFPSVGATENIILASLRCTGTTTIINAAREPEVVDLARFLNSCGARISGAGESTVYIEGVDRFHSSQYTVMPDRIAACTYMAAAAVTGSDILLDDIVPSHLASVMQCFETSGCKITSSQNRLRIISQGRLKPMGTVRTMPYPGFPTDCQSLIMTMASVADGTTVICENIFENRFRLAGELNRMGAAVSVHDKIAVVNGIRRLQGATVCAHDLRAGAALTVAGLCAEGTTTVENIHFIDRGYESLEKSLNYIGARIKRID
ncbi:MAG TPA: UDP-N-acetylglucosamine 1-carboxyvinyltransferase [Ruminococcaceae bacterium]|nr:UDP-N-acetylglucosamine 1-carboxyvinyltransferase [Oscillospiraceae bacterium]